jgi:hypothetical protein
MQPRYGDVPIDTRTKVLISHSLPLGNPMAFGSGTQLPAGSIVRVGAYLGEYLSNVRYVVRIPIFVPGSMNQSGLASSVDSSAISCRGNVRLKSR